MNDAQAVAQTLKNGGIAVIPTDTIYGIVARALDRAAVEKVYEAKGRTPSKPCIILISSIGDLAGFGVALAETQAAVAGSYWPGPVSIILPCPDSRLEYLHRGTHSLAFRLPDDERLLSLLKETGPLIAPSANPEGLPPATTVDEARAYFGDAAAYLDGGTRTGAPSILISLAEDGTVAVLRDNVAKK